MIVGFNHNFRYKGETYHIQTEDGGLKSPHIITLLYQAGTILASKKTSYSDILKVDNLEHVVEELMKEQHREMLRRLKEGEFDATIFGRKGATPAVAPVASVSAPAAPAAAAAPRQPAPSAPAAAAAAKPSRERPLEASLDEIILSYLVGDGDR